MPRDQRSGYLPESERYYSCGIALAGVYAATPNAHGPPGGLTTYENRLRPFLGELKEGGYVIDKRPMDHTKIIEVAVSGAMCQENLPPGTCQRFANWPKKTEPCHDASALGSFDHVSLDLYAQWMIRLGARVGVRHGDVIRYNDGVEYPIPGWNERLIHDVFIDPE